MSVSKPLPDYLLQELEECERAYLEREGPLKQSGWNGTYEKWKKIRGPILDAVEEDGHFLDVGCTNGYLLECLTDWSLKEKGISLIPHGVDYGGGLIELAKARLPKFGNNLHIGNMWDWEPPHKYDYVCTGLTVPDDFHDELFDRFISEFVAPNGRLILRRYYNKNEDRESSFNIEKYLRSRGYHPLGVFKDNGFPIYAWIDV